MEIIKKRESKKSSKLYEDLELTRKGFDEDG